MLHLRAGPRVRREVPDAGAHLPPHGGHAPQLGASSTGGHGRRGQTVCGGERKAPGWELRPWPFLLGLEVKSLQSVLTIQHYLYGKKGTKLYTFTLQFRVCESHPTEAGGGGRTHRRRAMTWERKLLEHSGSRPLGTGQRTARNDPVVALFIYLQFIFSISSNAA